MRPVPHAIRSAVLGALTLWAGAAAQAVDLAPVVVPPPEAPIVRALWPTVAARGAANPPAELVDTNGRLRCVSTPAIGVWLPPKEKNTGRALIVCAGGGYGGLDWTTHVIHAAPVFNARGVALIGLKYRTGLPGDADREVVRARALLDAQRAVRMVRRLAPDWGLDPHAIGIAGYSAGANVAMNLAANFDFGDPHAADPTERESCRPNFAVGIATWHWRQKESPFRFPTNAPPVFLVHATNDGIGGGAPIEMPRAIESDLRKLGVPVRFAVFDEGGHGVGNLLPNRVRAGFPPTQWPDLLLRWLDELRGTSPSVRPSSVPAPAIH